MNWFTLCDGGSRRCSSNGGCFRAGLDSSGGGSRSRRRSSSGGGSRGSRSSSRDSSGSSSITGGSGSVGLCIGWTVTADVTSLRALIADLTSGTERSTVRSSAVTRDVTQFPTGVALHSLSLAITGKVVGTTALVASGSTGVTTEVTAESRLEVTARTRGSSSAGGSRVGAATGKMTGLTAVVATAIGSAVQAESWAVSLDVAKTLAVIALLGLGSARTRASARLVSRLLAVIAKALGRRADLSIVANVATLVARTTRQHHYSLFLLYALPKKEHFGNSQFV